MIPVEELSKQTHAQARLRNLKRGAAIKQLFGWLLKVGQNFLLPTMISRMARLNCDKRSPTGSTNLIVRN